MLPTLVSPALHGEVREVYILVVAVVGAEDALEEGRTNEALAEVAEVLSPLTQAGGRVHGAGAVVRAGGDDHRLFFLDWGAVERLVYVV